MASKRRMRRVAERRCSRKRAYDTRGDALLIVRLRLGLLGMDAGVRPYHCRWCHRWHLGHPSTPRKREEMPRA